MLEGIERLVDLTGPRGAGLGGTSIDVVVDAVRRGDTAALGATGGHFAAVAREGRTVRLARTIGAPLRYFVAKMYHGPFLVVADRIDRIFEWCREERIAWQFDPAYTRMVPAHYLVEIDQVGCPDPAPRYRRFFEPAVGRGPSDIPVLGAAYVTAALTEATRWLAALPAEAPVAVAFSGGVDSTAALLIARRALETVGRDPEQARAFTLDLGGGPDAAQARETAAVLGLESVWESLAPSGGACDVGEAIDVIEDYHPLDVECAAAGLALLRGIRERHPEIRYLMDGDGGDENLKSYPLEDSDLTLSSVLRNPLLYQEGWGVDAIKHSVVYSGGLSRSYVRTAAPAATCGFEAFSPFSTRAVIAAAAAIPFDVVLADDPSRLATLKQEVVGAGVRDVLGIEMPLHPKRRFQDGAAAAPRVRLTKASCRKTFNRRWQQRMQDAELVEQRSGNDLTVARV